MLLKNASLDKLFVDQNERRSCYEQGVTAHIATNRFSYRAEAHLGGSLSTISAVASLSSLAIASVINKARQNSSLTKSQQTANGISGGDGSGHLVSSVLPVG
jgi:hypothetical protein